MRGRGNGTTSSEPAPLRAGDLTAAHKALMIQSLDQAVMEAEQELGMPSSFGEDQSPMDMTPAMDMVELFRYTGHLLGNGSNIQDGDHLVINASLEEAELAIAASLEAYKRGARRVTVLTDAESRKDYQEIFASIGFPAPVGVGSAQSASNWEDVLADGAAVLQLNYGASYDHAAMNPYNKALDKNAVRWTVGYWPTKTVAEKVYGPDVPDARQKFAQDLLYMTRTSNDDAPDAAQKHLANLHARAQKINSLQFDQIIIEDVEKGTQTSFGLLDTSEFRPCAWQTENGEMFACNLPSEEIFCTPDPARTNGPFSSTRPFKYNDPSGKTHIITEMEGEFKEGILQREGMFISCADKNVDPDALADAMYAHFQANPGLLRVGELALMGNDSRIAKLDRMFGIDNIDENSGCHFAIGESFLAGLKDIQDDERRNTADSEHIDITIGSNATKIWGITQDGRRALLMDNGQWAKQLLGDVE